MAWGFESLLRYYLILRHLWAKKRLHKCLVFISVFCLVLRHFFLFRYKMVIQKKQNFLMLDTLTVLFWWALMVSMAKNMDERRFLGGIKWFQSIWTQWSNVYNSLKWYAMHHWLFGVTLSYIYMYLVIRVLYIFMCTVYAHESNKKTKPSA